MSNDDVGITTTELQAKPHFLSYCTPITAKWYSSCPISCLCSQFILKFASFCLPYSLCLKSAKAIREFHGKKLASRWLSQYSGDVKYNLEDRALLITASSMRPEDTTNFDALAAQNPWLLTEKLVCKVCFSCVCARSSMYYSTTSYLLMLCLHDMIVAGSTDQTSW